MIDIVIIITTSICGFFVGKFLSKRSAQKKIFYADMLRYIDQFAFNVKNTQKELGAFDEEFSRDCSEAFCTYIKEGKCASGISKSSKTVLADFRKDLNCISSEELLKRLEYYKGIFSAEFNAVCDEYKKSSIYSKLGILLGVMAGILIV